MRTVCIIWPNGGSAYSETFIQAHVDRLPANVLMLHGGDFPKFQQDGRPLLTTRLLPGRTGRAVNRLLTHPTSRRMGPAFLRELSDFLLARFLVRNRVSAVLAEYGPTGVAVADACRVASVPLIVHFHGFDAYYAPLLRQHQHTYPRMFEKASALVAVSRDMEQQLVRLGAPPEKVFYNPYGVDTTLFSGASPATAPPIFLTVGRFVEKKAPHLTLLAFARARETVPDMRLIMIGEGPLWAACKDLAKGLGIEKAVDFRGARDHHEVAAAMRTARGFLQHSIRPPSGDAEGTPVVVIEAGAAGLPVISTRHGGIPDVVLDGETGFLVEERDIRSMAERMVRLGKDPVLAGRLGKAARERIRENFPIGRSIDNLWHIIEEAE